KRLSLLSKECNQLLSVASVIGRDFAMDTLKAVVTSMNEDTFVNALKEAVRLSVLEERSHVSIVRYRFTHAFFRQTLYEEMIAPQRLKLHQQVARALETQYAKRLEEHAAELAEHFSHSTDPTDLAEAVSYSELAAKRATDVYAYGEAARLLDQALKVQKVLNPDDKKEICKLLLALGDALLEAGQSPRRVLDQELLEAFTLAEVIGDRQSAAHACFLAILALAVEGAGLPQVYASVEGVAWAERADRYAAPGTVERARADLIMGIVKYNSGERCEGAVLMSRALELARRVNDADWFWYSSYIWLYYLDTPQRAVERLHVAEELVASSRAGVRPVTLTVGLWMASAVFLQWGQRHRAEEAWHDVKELAERSGHVYLLLLSAMFDGILAAVDGRLDEGEKISRLIMTLGEEVGITVLANALAFASCHRTWLFLGKAEETLKFVMAHIPMPRRQILCLAYLGRDKEVEGILEKLVVNRPYIGSVEDETTITDDIAFLEAAVMIKHRPSAELLLNRLANCGHPMASIYTPTSLDRHLGGAAALLGRYDEARKHYLEAIRVCTEMRFRPELALTRLQLAELLLEHYPAEKKEALEHLDFAIKEFREMKMQPSLERALRHKEILKA
ncbi:MAG: hypothetical protein ABSD79_05400, partial [Dehalococcoidales bacterium]